MRFLIFVTFLTSQTFAQKLEFTQPVRLNDQVNSKSEELSPILSHDGKTLYFARALDPANIGGELSGVDIWVSKKNQSGEWLAASNGTNWNNKYNNEVIGLNEDGTVVYLLNTYERGNGIAFSKLVGGVWSRPERISIPGVNPNEVSGYYMNLKFNVLLLSMKGKGSLGQEDLFVSLKDSSENWSAPVNLGPTINTVDFEISPFLSSNGKQIYFASNGHSGYGDADIFVAERLYDTWTLWGKPKNLGNKINSEKFDSGFRLHGDTLCFFVSNRDSDFSDIYKSSVLEEKPALSNKSEVSFLSASEINNIVDYSFNDKLVFNADSVNLSEIAINELRHLSNVLFQKTEISIRLNASKSTSDDELEMNQKRLLNILQYLKVLGIEGSRVTFGSEPGNAPISTDYGIIYIRLYR